MNLLLDMSILNIIMVKSIGKRETYCRAPVIRKAYWEVGIDQVTLGGKPMKVSAKGAAIDTG